VVFLVDLVHHDGVHVPLHLGSVNDPAGQTVATRVLGVKRGHLVGERPSQGLEDVLVVCTVVSVCWVLPGDAGKME